MKPMVFNYQDYVKLQEENKRLREENTNLQIRCRIAESENPDRNCEQCKHNKADGCSRWECEYEPVMSDLIKKSDAIKALYKYNFVSKNVIEREINALPSADTDMSDYCDRLWKIAYERGKADRPTGEWTDNHNGTFTCDQCGCKHSKSNYCPNCGARMYKGGEDE